MILIVLWILISLIVGMIGQSRKIGFAGSFLASLILSPVLGLLITALYPPKEDK
jgi:hypothetical protein